MKRSTDARPPAAKRFQVELDDLEDRIEYQISGLDESPESLRRAAEALFSVAMTILAELTD